ncbi:MAG: MFS transporter, partial [Clostridiales bacterium]|nr:MFS transporter [Clostridiales bacterium]
CFYIIIAGFLTTYFTDVGIPALAVAGVTLAVKIWDAINDPLIGFWAVNRKFKNGETSRPFALWHTVPWAITLVLLFTNFNVTMNLKVIIAIVVYILFEVFNTTVSLPYNSMAGLATSLDADRRSINIFRNLGACLGSGIGAIACLPLLKLFGGLNNDGNLTDSSDIGFFAVSIVMGVIIVIGGIIHYFTTKERVKQRSSDDKGLSFKQVALMLVKTRSWRINMIYIICYGIINLLLMTVLAYYATYVMGNTGAAMMIQAAYLVTAVFSSMCVGAIDKALGRRKTMILGSIIAMLGKIWFIADPFSAGSIYLNAITVGMSVTVAFVLFNTNRNNIVDIIEHRDGRRIDTMIATSDNLVSKLGEALVALLITQSLSFAGYNAALEVQPPMVITAINIMLGWAPLIASAIMLVAAFVIPIEQELKEAQEHRA